MIRTDEDDGAGAPPVMWRPTPADEQSSGVGRFLRWLERERGLSFDGYEELWRWSVDALEDCWGAVWQFFDVQASAPYSSVLNSRAMPGARWFEGARLNYAEAVLARAPHDRPALIAVAEGRQAREISRAELRGQVGALAAALRDLGVGPGIGSRRICRTSLRRWWACSPRPASGRCGPRAHRISGCAACSTGWVRWSPRC